MISSTGSAGSSLGDSQGRLALAVPQRDQRRDCLGPCSAVRSACGCRRHILQRDAVYKPFCHLILQLQHDALCQLGAYAVGCLECFVIPAENRQCHPVRLHHAQDGQPHLGPHPRHAGKHLKAGLLLLGGKAEQADIVLGNRKHRVDRGFAPGPGQRPGHTGRALGIVAHPAAAQHHKIEALFQDLAGQTVDHCNFPPQIGPALRGA